MDDQDDAQNQDAKLRRLIEVVQHTPQERRMWKEAMHQLLCYIPTQLTRCYHPSYPDVLNETLELIYQEIQEFEFRSDATTRHFITWIHYKLRHKYRTLELSREPSVLSLDERISGDHHTTFVEQLTDPRPSTLWELDAEIGKLHKQARHERIGKQLWLYIEQDPDERLRNCASRKYPRCNCQEIALRRYLRTPPQNLPQIASDLDIPYQTLFSQWKRKFHPLLKTIASEFGYLPNQNAS